MFPPLTAFSATMGTRLPPYWRTHVRTVTADSCDTGGTISVATAVTHATYNSVDRTIIPQPPPATGNNLLDSLENQIMQRVHTATSVVPSRSGSTTPLVLRARSP
jgi:hypothetical protein